MFREVSIQGYLCSGKSETILEMHCHLYRISTSLIPSTSPSPLPELPSISSYSPASPIPIISTTVQIRPGERFDILCRRDGDATDVTPQSHTDLSFDIFLDNFWITSTSMRASDIKRTQKKSPTFDRRVGGLRGITYLLLIS